MKGGTWHLDTITAALGAATKKTAEAATKVSKAFTAEVIHGVLGAECLLNYHVEPNPTATCGPVWSIYLARSKKEGAPHPVVSAWVLDKRALTAGASNSRIGARRLDSLIELCKKDVQHLARLKHPGVVRLVHPLEETRTQLVFLTEPVFASLDDVVHGGERLPAEARRELQSAQPSELEAKAGLGQIAEALHFLHHDAAIVHRAVSPTSILLTRSGAWKLAGFGFAAPVGVHASAGNSYDYSEQDPSPLGPSLTPPLAYAAPELIATGQPVAALPAADVFSLALVAYELFAHRPFLPVYCSLIEYESRIRGIALTDLPGIPHALESTLRPMLAPAPEARPPIAAFSGSSFFMGDVHLRALRFLDTFLQRDLQQRAAFLNDLPALAAHFDRRVLLYRVLPPLLGELRNPELQAAALPAVMTILKVQSPGEFRDVTLPVLRPLLETATGGALLQLTQSAPLLHAIAGGSGKCGGGGAAGDLVPKLLVRALEKGDPACQEDALKQVAALAQGLDYEALKQQILPAVHATCLSTTAAAVRVAAFRALAAAAHRVDVADAETMLKTATTCVAVDKTAPTAMCVLGLGEALAKQWGAKLAAERVLPTIAPLLVVPTLTSSQFATTAKTIRDIVSLVEKARGGQDGAVGGEAAFASGRNSPATSSNGATPTAARGQHSGFGGGGGVAMPSREAAAAAAVPFGGKASSNLYYSPAPIPSSRAAPESDPFAWPMPPPPQQQQPQIFSQPSPPKPAFAHSYTPAPAAKTSTASDPLAAMWSSSAAMAARPAAAVPSAAFDPFDDLALQHSDNKPQQNGAGQVQHSLI